MKVNILRKKYPTFFYQGYTYKRSGKDLHISFDFAIPPDISFKPKVVIKNIPKKYPDIENMVFHLGLVEMISYWKATASPQIIIEAGYLSAKQIAWFKDLILQGMGEYFFLNKINFTKKDFLIITSPEIMSPKLGLSRIPKSDLGDKVLVPIGGGKDAIVTLELLKKAKIPLRPFILNSKKEPTVSLIKKFIPSIGITNRPKKKLVSAITPGFILPKMLVIVIYTITKGIAFMNIKNPNSKSL